MGNVEDAVRKMIEARKESIEYYLSEIEDSIELYKGDPEALLRVTKFAARQIEKMEDEIFLLKSVLVAAGLAYNGEEV
jgi:hypothetical protein